jgi:hypothetical protein
MKLESEELNKDGEPNRAVHLFSYPAEVAEVKSSMEIFPLGFIPAGFSTYRYNISAMFQPELNFNSRTLTSNENTSAQNLITFTNGTMNVSSGISKFEAGHKIEITSEYDITATSGEVIFKVFDLDDTPPPCTYDNTGLITDADDVAKFCNPNRDNKYRGNQLSKAALENQERIKLKRLRSNSINLKVYPNPTAESLTIVSEDKVFEKVFIYDINGRLVYESNDDFKNEKRVDVNVSEYAEGIYFVKATTKTATITDKFLKTR